MSPKEQSRISRQLFRKKFCELNLDDPFFDTLKSDYPGFENWAKTAAANREVFAHYKADKFSLDGFLMLKIEENEADDIKPPLLADKIVKVCTFKIDAHNTKLGERFLKIVLDKTIASKSRYCYATIYPKQRSLINMLEKHGFFQYGEKGDSGELVYVKDMLTIHDELLKNYPNIKNDSNKYVLGIYPEYHTRMFPDSILKTENPDLIEDISFTNSIHKVYVSKIKGLEKLRPGDILLIYKTRNNQNSSPANYNACLTSVCVVEEIRKSSSFTTFDLFWKYCSRHNVFTQEELRPWYGKEYVHTIKMTYNIALPKRIILDTIRRVVVPSPQYWGFYQITTPQFQQLLQLAMVDESLIVN